MAALTILLCAAALAASDPPRAPVRVSAPATSVYVFTSPPAGPTPTEDEQGRLDSVRDVIDALKRHKQVTIVAGAAEGQVQVEVTGREKRDASGGFGGTAVTPLGETLLRLRVTYGSRQTEIKGAGQAYWSRAAKDAADRLVRWIVRVGAQPAIPRSSPATAPTARSPVPRPRRRPRQPARCGCPAASGAAGRNN